MTLVILSDIFITMNGITTITTKGQVTIPEPIRKALKVKIGDKVRFTNPSPSRRQVVMTVIPSDVVEQLFGSLSTKVKEPNYKKARLQAGKLLGKKYGLR